jgi:protein-tyrosine phosphatase
MKILFVCLGNICRSPIAEGVLRKMAEESNLLWEIASAGTENYHIGEAPHPSSQKVCVENGIDISTQRARRFEKADFAKYDKIYAMAEDVLHEIKQISKDAFDAYKVNLFLDELYPNENKSVKDPWYHNIDAYYEVYAEIKTCCAAIITKYKN